MWFELLNVDEKNKTNAIKQSINAVPSTESASLEDCSETDFVSDW